MYVNSDFSDLLRLFAASGVRYMVVGGYAVVQYTEPRYTKDLDLWIRTDPENARVVYDALRTFGAPLAEIGPDDFAQDGFVYQVGIAPVRVDIMMGLAGVSFDDAWPRREVVDFDGLPVVFIGRDDLVAAKRAAGRPQDLIDAEQLEAAKPA